jgi:hypothetical protein
MGLYIPRLAITQLAVPMTNARGLDGFLMLRALSVSAPGDRDTNNQDKDRRIAPLRSETNRWTAPTRRKK